MGTRVVIDVRTGRRTEHEFTPTPPPPSPPREKTTFEVLREEFDALKAALVAKGVL